MKRRTLATLVGVGAALAMLVVTGYLWKIARHHATVFVMMPAGLAYWLAMVTRSAIDPTAVITDQTEQRRKVGGRMVVVGRSTSTTRLSRRAALIWCAVTILVYIGLETAVYGIFTPTTS